MHKTIQKRKYTFPWEMCICDLSITLGDFHDVKRHKHKANVTRKHKANVESQSSSKIFYTSTGV